MNFESGTGLSLHYWFTAGDIINTRSWTYRGRRYCETWIRNTDGREWMTTGDLLGTAVNRGQRLAFAWCAANGAEAGDLVAVRNCTTGQSRVASQSIASEYVRRAYGRWGMLLALLAAVIIWQGDYAAELPPIVSAHWVLSLLALVLTAGLIGFVFSTQVDPDPEREVDQKIQIALAGMEYAWWELQRDAIPKHRNSGGFAQGRNRNAINSSRFQGAALANPQPVAMTLRHDA
ncbi:MAG: hypothetical protein O9341_11840 [Paucibacter sp.]|nr:hypothetical protein [Roseateles sp.]